MKRIFLFTILFTAITLSAQTNEGDSEMLQKLRQANRLLTSGGEEKAYRIYSECANAGNAQAMNALGILLQRGWGVEKDEAASVEWFLKSAEAGYERANVNLAQVYAKGLGTEQDFEKAVSYVEKMQTTQPKWANFTLGYYHYKGLGVEQNYEKAVEFFQQASENGSENANYFLGLSYRNGYGVERKEGEAQYYLQKAARMGHSYSKQELAEETAETQVPAVRLLRRSLNENDDQKTFRRIKRQNLKGNFSGEYEGSLVTYDYSGKQIVRDVALKLTVSAPDFQGKVFGEWIESDSIKATFEAFVTDSTLRFENTSYARTDYYNRRQAVKWDFTRAILEKTETADEIFLAGNIQMFSPRTKEPEKPMYISLRQKKENRETDESKFTAYFMPFGNDVRISFTNDKAQDTLLKLYSINGQFLYEEDLGNLPAASHSYIVNLPLASGQYIMYLQQGSTTQTSLLIKK